MNLDLGCFECEYIHLKVHRRLNDFLIENGGGWEGVGKRVKFIEDTK